MPEYKLTYGDARGMAENIRWVFAAAQVPFQDVRIPFDQWPLSEERKKELRLPWGQIPVLEIDDQIFGQSASIARHLARKYKLAGKDEFEQLKCDEIVDAFRDHGNKWSVLYPFLMDPKADQTKKAELLKNLTDVEIPKDLPRFNALLEKSPSGYFVPSGLTWADIWVVHNLTQLEIVFELKILKDYPAIQKLAEKVRNNPGIKEWIAKRPDTKF